MVVVVKHDFIPHFFHFYPIRAVGDCNKTYFHHELSCPSSLSLVCVLAISPTIYISLDVIIRPQINYLIPLMHNADAMFWPRLKSHLSKH